MRRLSGLAVCLALVLALSGCKKSDSEASSKKSSGPSGGPPSGPPPGYPGGSKGGPPSGPPGYPGRGPSSDGGDAPGTAQPQPEVMPEPEEPDDHSDDPWFDHEKAKTPAGEGEKKPAAEGEKKPAGAASGWEPDKGLLEQLETYKDVDGYQVRPPRGYASIQPPTPPGSKALRQDWQQTPAERGQVNGLSMHGGTFICIRSQDVAPHDEQALKLAEAAALTFRKK